MMNKTKSRKNHGFTLIELMIVIAIIAVMVAISLPQYMRFSSKAKRAEGISILKGLHQAELSYFTTEDTFPSQPQSGNYDNSFPPQLGFSLASPAKFYFFENPTEGGPTYSESNASIGFGAVPGDGYHVLLDGQLDGDPRKDQLCIVYPPVIPSVCSFAEAGLVHVIPTFDDVLLD